MLLRSCGRWFISCCLTVGGQFFLLGAAPAFVWIEGEQPTSVNCRPADDGVGHPEFLSQGKWLKVAVESDSVEKQVPAEGALIEYTLAMPTAADYEIWARIGFEFARSPFEWRMDAGEWKHVAPDELTTDLTELSFWTEIAWLKLGLQQLSSGTHKLAFRVPKSKNAEGKPQRILFALDAVCFSSGNFRPYSHFKPGQDHQEDRDREAARQVFEFKAPAGPDQRAVLPLRGTWEVCRHDEQMPGPVAEPIKDFPTEPRWTAIAVPGDKNDRPDLIFAHRLWYRTRVTIPATMAGRSFFLIFPQNNLNTTVFVNGQYCGFDKNPFARVQIDLGRSMRPGTNEIMVGIKDAWYGYSASPTNPLKLRKRWNLPKKFFNEGFQDLAYPIWGHPQSGILVTPELVAAGATYTSDVFVQPSVAKQELALEATLKNSTPDDFSGELLAEVLDTTGTRVELSFSSQPLQVSAGRERVLNLTQKWTHPKLWWPDDTNL